jgi:hypothetical protein
MRCMISFVMMCDMDKSGDLQEWNLNSFLMNLASRNVMSVVRNRVDVNNEIISLSVVSSCDREGSM